MPVQPNITALNFPNRPNPAQGHRPEGHGERRTKNEERAPYVLDRTRPPLSQSLHHHPWRPSHHRSFGFLVARFIVRRSGQERQGRAHPVFSKRPPPPPSIAANSASVQRALTSATPSDEDAMSCDDAGSPQTTMPGSPPDLTGSKSSKSSSFHSSYQSDNDGMITDVSHFEDIGLDDESREAEIGDFPVKISNLYSFTNDLRSRSKHRNRAPTPTVPHGSRKQRDLTAAVARPPYPSLRGQVRSATTDGLGLVPTHATSRRLTSPSSASSSMMRNRSTSPSLSFNRHRNLPTASLRPRRESWQSNRERKTAKELEMECDEDDDDDDVPDDCFLENIPMSPRNPRDRAASRPASTTTSPERPLKEKVRSVGNGTSPIPAEQGELRSSKPGTPISSRAVSMGQFPINHNNFKPRAKSWTDALSELSDEAKALTEALEAHAEDEEQREPDPRDLRRRQSSTAVAYAVEKNRHKSAIAELPPLRRTDIMIDPLPISKEKEAVLSRTRPSWLPPKDPSEEKRHLKEYQKMMELSREAERKREIKRQTKTTCRDDTASSLLRIWEEHVLPNWDNATRHKRTRELWWRGIAPRSRGLVWAKAIGNELGLSGSSYTAALRRAQALGKTIQGGSQLSAEEERKKDWLDSIDLDVIKTYPELKIFQPEGPLHGTLVDLLRAYAMYRSDVGYVHGTSTIAAMLLLNLPTPSDSFQALANLMNRPLPLSFLTSDSGAISRAYSLLLSTLEHKSPRLHTHLTNPNINLQPDEYLRDIFGSLFTSCLSLDNATRLWDVMVFEGDAVLVRAGVTYLISLEGNLFGAETKNEIRAIVQKGLDNVDEEQWMQGVRTTGRS